ncbi:MAG: hypothetical protein MR658_03080 [Campylobacter sp.]|nr:hypothetical protein [Campylobacter sp.]MCI6298566.1 hypothetical protein [Campylobacter sp.]MDD6925661.1 hypothetical protein [Campylobacteraceae bacterium]
MENSQIISISVSIASVLMAFVSVVLALWSANIAKSQKLINQNMQAIEIWREIGKNKEKIFSSHEKLFLVDNYEQAKLVFEKLESFYEDSRNFYEILCYSYEKGSIEKQYFKEMHKDNLKDFIENSINKEFYTEPTTKYTYTIKVYKKFK